MVKKVLSLPIMMRTITTSLYLLTLKEIQSATVVNKDGLIETVGSGAT